MTTATTMERLDNITKGFDKCTSISSIFEKFYFSKEAVKKYKVDECSVIKSKAEPKEKKECPKLLLEYNSKEAAKEDIKQEEKKSSSSEKDIKKSSKKEKPEEKKSSDSKITLESRIECPVHVMTNEEAVKKSKKVELNKDEQHRIKHLVHHLHENGLVFTEPQKMSTGLYETNITQTNGNVVPVSIDNDGKLYSDEIKFFIGQMKPGDEYEPTCPCFYMTKDSLAALKNGQMIPEKYMVPQELFILNKLVDLTSLKEKDPQKRSETFRNVSRIFTDKETFNAILKNANGESYRFAFCRYKSPDEFSLTSSGRNLLSNLSDEKQKVTKEQWINYKDKKIDLKVKSRTK